MKKLISIILLLLIIPLSASAEDLYYAQSQAGGNDGSSCANAIALSAIQWGAGAGKVSAGDTMHLCGTITSPFVIGGSGSEGSVITVKFEAGAKMSAAHWNQSASNGDAAIYGNGVSYIVLDGGINGIIESTANGTALANQLESIGASFNASSHVEVKNLTCQTMYVRTASSNDSRTLGGCFVFKGGQHDIKVHDVSVSDAQVTVTIQYTESGNDKDILLYNITGTKAAEGVIVIGSSRENSVIDNVQIHGNTLTKDLTWSGEASIHTNLIHVFAVQTGTSITNLKVFNNTFQGECGTNATSLAFLEGYITAPQVYNNLFHYTADLTGQGCGNGMFVPKGPTDLVFANNTLVSHVSGQGNGYGTSAFGAGDTGHSLLNNLFYNVGTAIYDSTHSISASDYNVFYSNPAPNFTHGTHYAFATFDQWKTHSGLDGNSTLSQPTLSAAYIPTADDVVAKWTGTATGQLSAADKMGVSWHSPPSIGAYEYVADTTAPAVTISTADSAISTDSLTIEGTSSDAVGVSSCKWRIGSAPTAGTGTLCTGTTTFTCSTSGYAVGANTVYVGCGDDAGNWGSDSIVATYTASGPYVGVGSGGRITIGTGGRITF